MSTPSASAFRRIIEGQAMLGIYFSGTGNTRHCIEAFFKQLGGNCPIAPMEAPDTAEAIEKHDFIVLAYPVYFSNVPKIVKDFILSNGNRFRGKKMFIIATMGLFSGDGAGCSARLLAKFGADIVGGLHLKMPDCIGDVKLLKRSAAKNREIVRRADEKIRAAAQKLQSDRPTRDGLGVLRHMAGLLGQRLWFYGKSSSCQEKPNVNAAKCIGCGRCADGCPMENIRVAQGKAVSGNRCAMCYRCVSLCPKKALTILGNEVFEQCRFENHR